METLKLRNGHPTKRALICYVLMKNGPMTRIPLMKAVHALEASKLAFQPTSNICYFLRDRYDNPYIRNESSQSVLKDQGPERPALVYRVGCQKRFHVYDLTPAGRLLALQAQEHYGF